MPGSTALGAGRSLPHVRGGADRLNDGPIPAGRFGLRERRGRNVFELIVLHADRWIYHGKTSADGNSNLFPFITEAVLSDGAADTLAQDDGAFEAGFRRHHHELF